MGVTFRNVLTLNAQSCTQIALLKLNSTGHQDIMFLYTICDFHGNKN